MEERAISIEQISNFLAENLRQEKSILVVYVFGSYARGDTHPESDLDLAFLVDEKRYKTDPFDATAPAHIISANIGIKFDIETDVTILNSASIEMAYDIVTKGKCVYFRDEDKKIEYEIKIRSLYYDFRPFLEELRKKTIAEL